MGWVLVQGAGQIPLQADGGSDLPGATLVGQGGTLTFLSSTHPHI